MPGKEEEAETVNLQNMGDGKDEGRRNAPAGASRRRQATAINKRVVVGVVVAVFIVILIIVGAWFIYTTVGDSQPEWLQTIPGLHYRPSSSVRDSLIMFRSTDEHSYQPWIDVIDEFLKDYRNERSSSNIMECNYTLFPPPGKVCEVDVRKFGVCTRESLYSYHRSSPCIFLKIHKFPNWVPEYYNVEDLPETMPDFLKSYIRSRRPEELKTVWVSCEGETPSDVELIGPITYIPRMGFPGYYFPYRNTEGYLSPLVAIQLERPTSGIVINIECKLWAKNIVHDREKGVGLVHFEVMID